MESALSAVGTWWPAVTSHFAAFLDEADSRRECSFRPRSVQGASADDCTWCETVPWENLQSFNLLGETGRSAVRIAVAWRRSSRKQVSWRGECYTSYTFGELLPFATSTLRSPSKLALFSVYLSRLSVHCGKTVVVQAWISLSLEHMTFWSIGSFLIKKPLASLVFGQIKFEVLYQNVRIVVFRHYWN